MRLSNEPSLNKGASVAGASVDLTPFPRRRFLASVMIFALALAALSPHSQALAAADKKKGGGETFLQLPSLTASIRHPDGRRGVLMVDVGLDIPDAALRARATSSVPRLRDAFTQVMLAYAPSIGANPPNPDTLSQQLQQAADRVLGRPGATVLLGTTLEN